MKKISVGLFLLFVLIIQLSYSQNFSEDKKNDLNIADPGVDFIIAGGIYMGSPKTAGYYGGYPENELHLDYVFSFKTQRDNIILSIVSNRPYVSATDTTIAIHDYPEKVHYQPAMSVCIGSSYRFDEHWRINIYYTFARLTAKSVFNMTYDNRVPGNDHPEYLGYLLMGKENRSFFDLTGSYTFQFNRIFKPFIELGAQFNFVKVKSLDAIIEDREYSLFNRSTGINPDGTPVIDGKPNYGGAGFGVTGVIGAKLAFNKSVSVDPCFYVSFGKVGLNGYKDFHLNWGAYIRLVLSDSMLQR